MIARPRALSLRDKTFASQETASPGTGVPSNLGWPCEARGLSFPGPWKGTISLLQSVSREGCVDWILECSNFFPVENVYPGGSLKFTRSTRPLPPRGYARGKDGLRQSLLVEPPGSGDWGSPWRAHAFSVPGVATSLGLSDAAAFEFSMLL